MKVSNYIVHNTGSIFSKLSNKFMKPRKDKDGYLLVNLVVDGKSTTYKVHRLVAEAFVPNPDNLPIVNHIDEDKTNNHHSNLEWCTIQYNNAYSFAKTYVFTYPNGKEVIDTNLRGFCRKHNLTHQLLQKVVYGERNHHKGFKARYFHGNR